MKVRERGLSLFLTLAVVFVVFANDIRMTEAEEQTGTILEAAESEKAWSESGAEEETALEEAEPEETCQGGTLPGEPSSGDKSAEELAPGERPLADEFVEGALLPDEPVKELQPGLSSVGNPFPAEESVEETLQEELLPSNAPAEKTLPEERLPLNEFTEKMSLKEIIHENILSEAVQKTESATTYVPAESVILTDEVTGKTQAGSRLNYEDMELPAGEVLTIQYRPKFNIRCLNSKCVNTAYQYTPIMYGKMDTEVSEPGIVGKCEFSDGVWTSDDIMYGSACLCLNSTAERPGTVTVKAFFYTRYDIYLGYEKRCPLCQFRLGPNDYRGVWFDCNIQTNVRVYADYILKYDANAGSDTVHDIPSTVKEREYTVSKEMEVTDTEPVREGYIFLGWSEDEDAWKADYKAGDPIKLEWKEGAAVEKTLYAVWDKKIPTFITGEPEEEPDLTVIKRACGVDGVTEIASVEAGEEYNYTITVKNKTSNKVRDIQISEALDTSLVQLLNHPTKYENGIWKIDFLEGGETAVLTLHVKAVATSEAYENTIGVTVKGKEISPGSDDIRSATVTIKEPSNLTIRKEADKQEAAAGELITYKIIVKNPAIAADALDVTIVDQLPEGLKWTEAVLTTDKGTMDPSDDRKISLKKEPEDGIYKAGNLKAGESAILTMTAAAVRADMTVTNQAIAYKSGSPEVKDSASTIIGGASVSEEKREQEPDEGKEADSGPEEPPYEYMEAEHVLTKDIGTVSVQRADPYVFRLSEQVQNEPYMVSRKTEVSGPGDQSDVSEEEQETSLRKSVKAGDLPLPLTDRGHLCCILHFAIMLLALFTELLYMKSVKRHQREIFDLRGKLEEISYMEQR